MRTTEYESDEMFFEKLGVEREMFFICVTIRKVLSYWLGIPTISILADSSPSEYQCDGWDSEEFIWQILYELDMEDCCPIDFPNFFPCNIFFLKKEKKYKTVKDWMIIAIRSIKQCCQKT
jgi:hypothetical protein